MFELGFTEILLIGVVALVVLGPERLPVVARQIGVWVGKAQRMVSSVKSELNRQVDTNSLREVKDSLQNAAHELRGSLHDLEQTAQHYSQEVSDSLNVPAWERLPEMRTPADFGVDEFGNPLPDHAHYSQNHQSPLGGLHTLTLRRQSLKIRRDIRPKVRPQPKLRVRHKHSR